MPRQKKSPAGFVIEVLKSNRRTLTGVALLAVLAATLTLAKYWVSDPYRFPLDIVEVKGDFRYLDKQQLKDAVSMQVAGGFFTVDVSAIRAAAEDLPWVYKAKVRRVWPATLRINIEEQQAIARWGKQGYLNSKGEPFFPAALVSVLRLPALAGPEGHELNVLESYQRITQTLAPIQIEVTHMELDSRRAWHLQVGDGVRLELGRADTSDRLQRFISAWPTVFAGRIEELQRVDLRYSNGFSVHWQQFAVTPDTGSQGQGT